MVSVLIPVYNAKNTIFGCVDSIICQSYKDYEIIIIDDGSTDGSGAVCDELARKYTSEGYKLRVIHQENRGVSAARNRGMDAAEGNYFVCVDSDDTVAETYLQDMVELQENHREFGHVCCGFKSLSQTGKEYVFSDKEQFSVSDRACYMQLMEKVLVQSPCTRLYRTDVVKNNNIRMRTDLSLGEDLLFNLDYFDALDNTKIGIVNRANYFYHDAGDGSLNRKFRPDLFNIFSEIHSGMKAHLEKWSAFDENSRKKFYNYAFNNYCIALDNTYSEKCPLTAVEKRKKNDYILKSPEFKTALENVRLKKLMKAAYRSGRYLLVRLAKQICRIINFMGRRFR